MADGQLSASGLNDCIPAECSFTTWSDLKVASVFLKVPAHLLSACSESFRQNAQRHWWQIESASGARGRPSSGSADLPDDSATCRYRCRPTTDRINGRPSPELWHLMPGADRGQCDGVVVGAGVLSIISTQRSTRRTVRTGPLNCSVRWRCARQPGRQARFTGSAQKKLLNRFHTYCTDFSSLVTLRTFLCSLMTRCCTFCM